jgi:hypothetical protein
MHVLRTCFPKESNWRDAGLHDSDFVAFGALADGHEYPLPGSPIVSTDAVGRQALHNDPQKNAHHHAQQRPFTRHEVTQSLRDREHPLAHRQTGKDVIQQVRHCLHYAPVLQEAQTPGPLQE